MSDIGLYIKVRADSEQARKGLAAIEQQAKRMGLGVQAAGKEGAASTAQLGESLRRAGHHMALMAGDALLLAKGMQAVKGALAVGASFESIGATMRFATGSAQGAARAMDFIRASSDALGLPLQTAAGAFAKLAAASKGTKLEGAGVQKVFFSVASAARVMGLSSAEMEGALLAISQMMSKGTVSAEELRGQLGERIPGAFGIAARAAGVTEKEFNKLLDSGKILAADFLPKFAAALQDSVSGALPDATRTFAAEVERMKNAFVLFADEVARAGVMEEFTRLAREAADEIKRMANTGELQAFARDVAALMRDAAGILGTVTRFLIEHREAVLNVAQAYVALRAAVLIKGLAGFGKNMAQGAIDAARWSRGLDAAATAAKGLDVAFVGVQRIVKALPAVVSIGVMFDIITRINAAASDAKGNFAKASDIALRGAARAEAVGLEIANALLDRPRQAREAAEAAHAGAVGKIKADMLVQIKANLASQVQAHDEANKSLAAAINRRQKIETDNQAFIAGLAAPKAKTGEDISLIDVGGATALARQRLAAGDAEGAIQAGEDAKRMITELKDSGRESTLVLQGMAKQVAALQGQAAQALQAEEQARVQDIDKAIQDTLNKAEWLKRIGIGFDQQAAVQSAEALREALQAKLNANPIKQPVVLVPQGEDDNDKRVERMLGIPAKATGGLISGPGSDTSDNLLAWLSPGEFVMRAAAVRRWGTGLLAAMNAGSLPARAVAGLPRFAAGGLVGAAPNFPHLGRIDLGIGGGSYPVYVEPDIAAALSRASLARGGRL